MTEDKNNLLETGYDPRYASYCDHTVLRAYTVRDKVAEFCREAVEYGAASVCVNPVHVAFVHKLLEGSGVKTSTVIGFPLGANKTCVKALEAEEAVRDGADEVDMVINIGALKDGCFTAVLEDIKAVTDAAQRAVPKKVQVKVIIETCYLTREEIQKACELAMEAGADYIKTSTGMGSGGARAEDVLFIRAIVGGRMKIKASGSISSRSAARELLLAGADRLGVSRTPQIVWDQEEMDSAAAANQPPCFP
jgi:deoxyribose-phosphate aldolase